jgi:hypothetical protein
MLRPSRGLLCCMVMRVRRGSGSIGKLEQKTHPLSM